MEKYMIGFIKRYLQKKVYNLIDEYISNKVTDISFLEKLDATWESYLYVKHNMYNCIRLQGALPTLDVALEHCCIAGLFLEFGVFKGYTINYMSNKITEKTFYGFDSFEGLPEKWRTGYDKSAFDIQGQLPIVNGNVELMKGWFDKTLPSFLESNEGPVSFLHIDCDLYSSTKTVLDLLKDRIVTGTIIVFDEYFNYPGWELHEYKAFQEFVNANNITYKYLAFNSKHEQVVVSIL
jgi:predicted O-methyltransferase YrrM